MNKIKNFFADWSWKEKAWLAFVLIVQTVAWGIQKESAFMLIMTLTSSLNLVLGAKGKVAGLYFAIINSALYAINCMGIPLYGEVTYHDTKDHGYNSSGNARWCVRLHADPEVDGWKSSIHGFSDNGSIGCCKLPVSASFLRAVGNVGNRKCIVNCDVDHGIYAG